MSKVIELIKLYPVRVMAVITAIISVLAFYFGDVPWPLVLAVFAAIVGGGETAAHFVTPMEKLHPVADPNATTVVSMEAKDKLYVWKP